MILNLSQTAINTYNNIQTQAHAGNRVENVIECCQWLMSGTAYDPNNDPQPKVIIPENLHPFIKYDFLEVLMSVLTPNVDADNNQYYTPEFFQHLFDHHAANFAADSSFNVKEALCIHLLEPELLLIDFPLAAEDDMHSAQSESPIADSTFMQAPALPHVESVHNINAMPTGEIRLRWKVSERIDLSDENDPVLIALKTFYNELENAVPAKQTCTKLLTDARGTQAEETFDYIPLICLNGLHNYEDAAQIKITREAPLLPSDFSDFTLFLRTIKRDGIDIKNIAAFLPTVIMDNQNKLPDNSSIDDCERIDLKAVKDSPLFANYFDLQAFNQLINLLSLTLKELHDLLPASLRDPKKLIALSTAPLPFFQPAVLEFVFQGHTEKELPYDEKTFSQILLNLLDQEVLLPTDFHPVALSAAQASLTKIYDALTDANKQEWVLTCSSEKIEYAMHTHRRLFEIMNQVLLTVDFARVQKSIWFWVQEQTQMRNNPNSEHLFSLRNHYHNQLFTKQMNEAPQNEVAEFLALVDDYTQSNWDARKKVRTFIQDELDVYQKAVSTLQNQLLKELEDIASKDASDSMIDILRELEKNNKKTMGDFREMMDLLTSAENFDEIFKRVMSIIEKIKNKESDDDLQTRETYTANIASFQLAEQRARIIKNLLASQNVGSFFYRISQVPELLHDFTIEDWQAIIKNQQCVQVLKSANNMALLTLPALRRAFMEAAFTAEDKKANLQEIVSWVMLAGSFSPDEWVEIIDALPNETMDFYKNAPLTLEITLEDGRKNTLEQWIQTRLHFIEDAKENAKNPNDAHAFRQFPGEVGTEKSLSEGKLIEQKTADEKEATAMGVSLRHNAYSPALLQQSSADGVKVKLKNDTSKKASRWDDDDADDDADLDDKLIAKQKAAADVQLTKEIPKLNHLSTPKPSVSTLPSIQTELTYWIKHELPTINPHQATENDLAPIFHYLNKEEKTLRQGAAHLPAPREFIPANERFVTLSFYDPRRAVDEASQGEQIDAERLKMIFSTFFSMADRNSGLQPKKILGQVLPPCPTQAKDNTFDCGFIVAQAAKNMLVSLFAPSMHASLTNQYEKLGQNLTELETKKETLSQDDYNTKRAELTQIKKEVTRELKRLASKKPVISFEGDTIPAIQFLRPTYMPSSANYAKYSEYLKYQHFLEHRAAMSNEELRDYKEFLDPNYEPKQIDLSYLGHFMQFRQAVAKIFSTQGETISFLPLEVGGHWIMLVASSNVENKVPQFNLEALDLAGAKNTPEFAKKTLAVRKNQEAFLKSDKVVNKDGIIELPNFCFYVEMLKPFNKGNHCKDYVTYLSWDEEKKVVQYKRFSGEKLELVCEGILPEATATFKVQSEKRLEALLKNELFQFEVMRETEKKGHAQKETTFQVNYSIVETKKEQERQTYTAWFRSRIFSLMDQPSHALGSWVNRYVTQYSYISVKDARRDSRILGKLLFDHLLSELKACYPGFEEQICEDMIQYLSDKMLSKLKMNMIEKLATEIVRQVGYLPDQYDCKNFLKTLFRIDNVLADVVSDLEELEPRFNILDKLTEALSKKLTHKPNSALFSRFIPISNSGVRPLAPPQTQAGFFNSLVSTVSISANGNINEPPMKPSQWSSVIEKLVSDLNKLLENETVSDPIKQATTFIAQVKTIARERTLADVLEKLDERMEESLRSGLATNRLDSFNKNKKPLFLLALGTLTLVNTNKLSSEKLIAYIESKDKKESIELPDGTSIHPYQYLIKLIKDAVGKAKMPVEVVKFDKVNNTMNHQYNGSF